MNWKRAFFLIISLFIIFSVGCSADYEKGGEIFITDYEKTEEDNMYTNEELKFYPKHPSGDKTHQIETTAMPLLEQEAPFGAKTLCDEFTADADSFFAKYVDKRFEITGIAKKTGPDIHNKPSIEISDSIDGQTYALVIFPTDDHYSKVEVGDTVIVRANYLVMSNHYGTVMKYSELVSVENEKDSSIHQEQMILNYPLFDGEKVTENASVVIEDGVITQITEMEGESGNSEFLLMPGLIDAHTHMSTQEQIDAMLKNGVIGTCDVAATESLVQNAKPFTIVSSFGMTMGTSNGKSYVKAAIDAGAEYIKVLLMEPNLMKKSVLEDICSTAHDNGIKVAVHAVSIKAVQMSVDCGADILIHVPMKEEFPEELAKEIAKNGIVVAPTLVMMETFANCGWNGYKPEHYQNAQNAVKLLYENGVTILAATDANTGSYAPAVAYGTSMYREMELLVQAGMAPIEVLASATRKIAEVFSIDDIGTVEEGKKAVLILIEGKPNINITDTTKIKQIWIDGKEIKQ